MLRVTIAAVAKALAKAEILDFILVLP